MRWQGKQFSLTYSQANVITNKEELYQHLLKEKHLEYLCVAEELHQDGGRHYHAHIIYSRRKDIKNSRYYDFKQIHPNIQITDKPTSWNNYIKEDKNFVENTAYSEQEEFDLFDSARRLDYEDYIRQCVENRIQPTYATLAWNYTHTVDTTIDEQDEILGSVSHELNWFIAPIANKTTVIVGPSGIGKTVYAKRKATKPCLFVSHMDDLKAFKPGHHKSILFDDMCFTHLPVTGQIHLVDIFEPRSIHVRYGTVKIPAGVEKWVTCNRFPFEDHPAIARRINKIDLY